MKSIKLILLTIALMQFSCSQKTSMQKVESSLFDESKEEVLEIIKRVNNHWQEKHPKPGNSFWHVSAYHTGNMEAFKITQDSTYYDYSLEWAEHNNWKGATSDDRSKWKYHYGEKPDHVLFGDWQICFQTYVDLYVMGGKKNPEQIARAIEVMEYQMSTNEVDYWWWADGLYMVMPVMTKLFKITKNEQYLDKLYEYHKYAESIMYDAEERLYYRDAKYVYPKHKTPNGLKDFWARGDGWVFAGIAKVLTDLPKDHEHRPYFEQRFKDMAEALAASQQQDGYWTRSILDSEFAPGPETSGTAFFTYGFIWGVNNGLLDAQTYLPTIERSWNYLTEIALQEDGSIGYVQPIGEKAIPGQVVDKNSTADFGVGAFLLAACEMFRFLS